MIGILLFSFTMSTLVQFVPTLTFFTAIFNQIALALVLGYLVLNRRIFETTRIGTEQALESLAEGIAIIAPNRSVLSANRAMQNYLGLRVGTRLDTPDASTYDNTTLLALCGAERREQVLNLGRYTISLAASPIYNRIGKLQGHLLLARDITQNYAYERELQARQHALEHTVADLEQAQAARQEMAETVQALSLPIIPVAQGVIVLPLIGQIDSQRAINLQERLLQGVQNYNAHTVLLDLTGVPLVDQPVAHILLRSLAGTRLLGARVVLVGIRPEIAESLVALDLDTTLLRTAPTLQTALATLRTT